MKDVERLSTGTLYGGLARMLEQGWIRRVEEASEGGRPRKAYVLSDLGRHILAAETERLAALVAAARPRLAEG